MSHRSRNRETIRAQREALRDHVREQVRTNRAHRRDRWSQAEARRRARRVVDRAADNRVTGAVLITVGANWLLMELGLFPFGVMGLLALALAVMGLALMATAKAGSAAKFVVLGVILTGALVLSGGVANPIRGQFAGDAVHRPATLSAVRTDYSMGFGDLVLDLTAVDFETVPTEIRASLVAGDLRVILPADAAVDIDARIGGAGEIQLLAEDGVSGAGGVTDRFRDRGWNSADERVKLDLDLNFGDIVVERAR